MEASAPVHLFLLGEDYHLGDLLWLTAVLAEYRRLRRPRLLVVACPDRPISRILQDNPLIDVLIYVKGNRPLADARRRLGEALIVHDLRPIALAIAMLRDRGRRPPWRYFSDLWLLERGQWLATFLRLGRMRRFRPVIGLSEEDYTSAAALPAPYVALAPHIGQYRLPLAGAFWRNMKGWPLARWTALARRLRERGYTPVTLAAAGQAPLPGTQPLIGLPIRQVAGVIGGAAGLISCESGLWFLAAAQQTPFLVVPWWLPRAVDWAAPMGVPHRLVRHGDDTMAEVFAHFRELVPDV